MKKREKNIFVFGLGLLLGGLPFWVKAQWNVEGYMSYGLPYGEVGGIIENLLFWLLGLFTFFGLIGFIVSGIMYLVSAGNEEMIGKAKKYMTWSAVGIIVGLSGFVILKAVDAMLNASSWYF